MILKENDFLYKCKLNDITAIQVKEMLKNSNVVLVYDLEDFLGICRACETFVVFYTYKYYSKDSLQIDDDFKACEIRRADNFRSNPGALRATIAEHIDKWNELIETVDYTQPYELRLIASLNGVVTEIVYRDPWLNIQCGAIPIHVLPDMYGRDIASTITHQLVFKHNSN